jgi:hypothetical protein
MDVLINIKMALQKETKLGLTYGQILTTLTLISGIFLAWQTINVRIATAELKIAELENGRITNAQNIETIRTENRDDHKAISEKLDRIIFEMKK